MTPFLTNGRDFRSDHESPFDASASEASREKCNEAQESNFYQKWVGKAAIDAAVELFYKKFWPMIGSSISSLTSTWISDAGSKKPSLPPLLAGLFPGPERTRVRPPEFE